MNFLGFPLLQKSWPLLVCMLVAGVELGAEAYHVGFSLCKNGAQNVTTKTAIVGPWNTNPSSNRGLYLLGVEFDKENIAAVMPSSGIYFFILKIFLKKTMPKSRYGLRLKSSYSDRTISAWTSNYESDSVLTLSDNIRLSVGERVYLTLQVDDGNVEILDQSWFAMQLLGEFTLLPSFLARPVSDERVLKKKNVQIFNWKKYHESMTSFSSAGGIFVPVVTGYYICNLNLVMEDVFGIVQINFYVDDVSKFVISKLFKHRESVASFHLSKAFRLQKKTILRPEFNSLNASIVISRTTTFSCSLAGDKRRSMELFIPPSSNNEINTQSWQEVNFWKVNQASKYFKLLVEDGKVFSLSEDSLVLISLSLTVESLKDASVVVAVIPGGVKSKGGLCRSVLQLRSKIQETVTLACFVKVKERESSYISVFLKSESHERLRIESGDLKVIAVEQPLSVLTTPFFESEYGLNSSEFRFGGKWQVLRVDRNVQNKPFRTSSVHWNVEEHSFSPKESGIYFISVNLQADVTNKSSVISDTIEAKLVSLGRNERIPLDLQYQIHGLNHGNNSLILAGTFSLKSNDKVSVVYKCLNCIVSQSSGFSAVWLFKLFKVEGFSTKMVSNKKLLMGQNVIVNNWSRYFSNFIRTHSFEFEKGTYVAPFDGMFLVTCSLTVVNVSANTSLKLRLNVANSTRSYSEYFYATSKERKISSLAICMPIWLNQGQQFSLLLETDSSQGIRESFTLRHGSTFSIVAVEDAQDNSLAGFTLSLRDNLKSLNMMPSRSLLGWTDAKMSGAFFKKNDNLFKFNKRQGEISIRKPAVIMLNIIVNAKFEVSKQLTLNVKIEEKDVERMFTSRSLHLTDRKLHEPLKISLVLYVRSKDTIRVEVKGPKRGSTYDVLDNTVMSAIFLSDVPMKPGLMLGIRGYNVTLGRKIAVYRFKIKNNCNGCYQDGIIYDESQGHFKIPFAGRYLVSMNFNYRVKSSSAASPQCGIYVVESDSFLALNDVGSDNRFQLSEILEFNKSEALSFACYSSVEVELIDKNFISISLIQVSVPFTNSSLRRREHFGHILSELVTRVSETAKYLVVINGDNETISNLQLLVESKERKDIIFDDVDVASGNTFSLFAIVKLDTTSQVSLRWKGQAIESDRNRSSLYRIERSTYTITNRLAEDFLITQSNRTSHRVRNWKRSHRFGNELKFDYKRSIFIAGEPGEYMLIANARTIAKNNGKRWVYVAIDDDQEKDSFTIPLCQSSNGRSCWTSFIQTIKLQKWQSIGLYIRLINESDALTVLKGTQFSIVMLEVKVPTYIDPGPRFTSQPWPIFKNISSTFDWKCDAVGSDEISYKWNWISRETKTKKFAGYGQNLRVFGRPEESGYYFCSAEMDGTLHNSRIATLDISDNDECNLNATEAKQLCHEDAFCINTIGSYLCRCNDGFQGNGFSLCKDIDECKLNGTCHTNASCRNTKGSYTCKCNAGFYGNGTHCQDIDECKSRNKCHVDSICINEVGSYRCICNAGFSGDGESCANINECNNEEYPCHNKALCSDTKGSFTCKCKSGWTGNGTVCTDINECLVTNCTGNATCHNEPGRYRCICNRGFKGDGLIHCEALGCTPPAHCIGEYKAAWWSRSPYLANSSNKEPIGLFKDLLTQVIIDCCANCSLLSFDGPFNGSLEVEAGIEGNKTFDFGCPLYGSPDQTLFRGHPFMPVVESPGIAFFIKDQPKQRSALIGSLGSTWPILAITFLLACLSGVIMWFLDTVRNPTEFPNSFIEGSWEGFWWAFITMTTVGYGDKAPRSFPARLFGIVWILVGLVIISTFTATITTMLTASSLSDETKLYGTKVGVLHNSEEYRLGVKRNAETKGFSSVAEIVGKIKEGEVQGILLDTYIAGEYQDQLKDLRLQQVIDYTFSYGVVLSRDALALRKCFSHFLESKQSQIYSTISRVIKPLKTSGQQNYAAKKSANIFDADSVYFKYIIMVGLSTFAGLFLIGLIWECYITRQRKTQYTLANHNDPKESDMMQWRVQWESGKVSHFSSNIFRSDIGDLKQQIKEFAETWISRLDDLEKKQQQEITDLKIQETKRHQNKHNDSKFGRILKYFRRTAKTDTNGVGHRMTTAL